jgi:hypothetical protein
MKYFSLIFITLILFASCSQNKIDKLIIVSIDNSLESSKASADNSSNFIYRQYLSNPPKTKQAYFICKKNEATVDSFKQKSIRITDLEELQKAYNQSIDVIVKTSAPYTNYSAPITKYKVIKNNYLHSTIDDISIIKKMMLNDLYINQKDLTIQISMCFDATCRGYYWLNITTEEVFKPSNTPQQYTFALNDTAFAYHKNNDNCNIEIQSITKNGKNYYVPTTIKNNPTFATIDVDSLSKGKYVIKGNATIISPIGKGIDVPFSHSFEVK